MDSLNTREEMAERILGGDDSEKYTLITVSGGIGVLSTGDRQFVTDSIITAHSMFARDDSDG